MEKLFKTELQSELNNILEYWKNFSVDKENGGFIGRRDHYNRPVENAPKGIILNTRILWTFSAVGNFQQDQDCIPYAERAFQYLKDNFRDKEFGGVFWELDAKGKPVNKRKQIYAQAFAVYALSEYYKLTKNEEAKEWAISMFHLIEKHSRDRELNGYFEACRQDWSPIEDMRLSEKDRNSAKTMNTHLHILEAYTTLLEITGDKAVEEALENLSLLLIDRFYDEKIQHFQLFFDEHWQREGKVISFGHDIEAAWLLMEAAKEVKNVALINRARDLAVTVAKTFLEEAYVPGGGVINEKDLDSGKVDTDRHWWPQAEAMVGLHYAYRISGEEHFKSAMLDIWKFTKEHILDHENGEWFFRIDEHYKPYKEEDKLGMWKCPYHNSRACLVLMQQDI